MVDKSYQGSLRSYAGSGNLQGLHFESVSVSARRQIRLLTEILRDESWDSHQEGFGPWQNNSVVTVAPWTVLRGRAEIVEVYHSIVSDRRHFQTSCGSGET